MIVNNPAALDEMMEGLANYRGELGPGPYWATNQRSTLSWLKTNDLNTFRSFEGSGKALNNFGGGSWWPSIEETQKKQLLIFNSVLHKMFQKMRFDLGINYYRSRAKRYSDELRLRNMFLIQLESLCRARDTTKLLDDIEASLIGKPSDALEMDGRAYTPNFLISFLRYLDMHDQIDFDSVKSYVEIGPGVGLFAEVLAKLKPSLDIYLIDIPPQLYVLQQILQAMFKDRVITYKDIQNNPALLQTGSGNIFLLAPWQIDLLDLDKLSLAHNSGFGEMQKSTVETYLSYFRLWKTEHIYICSLDTPKTPTSIKTDDYVDLLPGYKQVARIQTRSAKSLAPLTTLGTKTSIRPNSDIYFRRVL